jgi:surfeit locus 1 family protein
MLHGVKLYGLLVASALGITALTALGLWQLDRREWKEALLADLELALSPSADALDLASAELLLETRDYIRVQLKGRFDHSQERYLFAVLEREAGWHVITPFITTDRRLVLVNRGFAPDRLKDPRTRPESTLNGDIELSGLLRPKPRAGMFTPANQPARNIWYWADLDALKASFELPYSLQPVEGIVLALGPGRAPWPQPVPPDPSAIPNNHLQYALTWFALAAALAVMTFLLLRSLQVPQRRG